MLPKLANLAILQLQKGETGTCELILWSKNVLQPVQALRGLVYWQAGKPLPIEPILADRPHFPGEHLYDSACYCTTRLTLWESGVNTPPVRVPYPASAAKLSGVYYYEWGASPISCKWNWM
jgi:hypothetical protein